MNNDMTAYIIKAYQYSRYAARWNMVNLSPVVQPYMELAETGTRVSRYDPTETAAHFALYYAQREGGAWEVHTWYRDGGFGFDRRPHGIEGARAVGPRMEMAGDLWVYPTAMLTRPGVVNVG